MKSKTLKLYIYKHIEKYGKLPKHKPSEKTKYAYYCRKLIEQGKIRKTGYGVWEVQQVQKRQEGSYENFGKFKDRGHAYRFVLKVPVINNWKRRVDYLKKKDISFKSINGGQIIKCRRHNIFLYDSSIMVTFTRGKSYVDTNPEANDQKAIIEFKKTITALSNKLRTDFKVDKNNYVFSCHHANINNMIAKYHLDRGINKFSIKDEFGKEWLLMDNSFNLMELETIHQDTATEDMKSIVIPLMNRLKKNPKVLDEFDEKLDKIASLLELSVKSSYSTAKSVEFLVNRGINPNPSIHKDDTNLADYFG